MHNHIAMYIYIYNHVYLFIYIYIDTYCVYVYIYMTIYVICMYACMYVRTYIHTHVCVCVCIYIYIYVYVYIYIHIYILYTQHVSQCRYIWYIFLYQDKSSVGCHFFTHEPPKLFPGLSDPKGARPAQDNGSSQLDLPINHD